MALSVTHTLQTAIADDPSFDVSSSEWNAAHSMTGTLAVASGGTDIASYAVGDLLYASAATTLAKLPDVATGNALVSGGVTTAPAWGKVGLTTHITGTLPVGNGGTNITTYAVGDLLYASGTGVLAKLADVVAGNALLSGGVNLAPAWGKVNLAAGGHVTGTLPVGNGGTGVTAAGALTKTDDTNVTLTLGGGPSTALLSATSITAGWTGTLSVARGGTAAATAAAALTNLGAVAKIGDTMTGTLNANSTTEYENILIRGNTKPGIHLWPTTGSTDDSWIFQEGNVLYITNNAGSGIAFQMDLPTAVATFTNSPLAPTPATADNTTKAATTAYVKANLGSYLPLAGGTMTDTLYLQGAQSLVLTGSATPQMTWAPSSGATVNGQIYQSGDVLNFAAAGVGVKADLNLSTGIFSANIDCGTY